MDQGELDILNCAATGKVEFELVCDVGWDSMVETGMPNQRFCTGCKRHVYRCLNAVDAGLRAEQGECIAVPAWLAADARSEGLPKGVIGRPKSKQEFFEELVASKLSTP